MALLPDAEIAPYALCPSADGVMIRWGSGESSSSLEFWPEGDASGTRCVPGQDRGDGLWETVLTGLRPGTRYLCRRDTASAIRSFRTAPTDSGAAFTIAIFGDPQNLVHYPEAVATMVACQPDLAIGLGDYLGRSDGASYRRFLTFSENLLGTTALLAVPGNHDYRLHSNPFPKDNDRQVFDRYLGDARNPHVALSWGRLLLLGLDYADRGAWAVDGPEATWLRSQLHSARQADQRVVLFQHCPCFTSTRATWAADDRVLPALLSEFADVVLADFGGHVHTYERSLFPDARGITYITSGGAGELYDFPVNECPNPYQVVAADCLHICLLQVRPDRVSMKAVGLEGELLDDCLLG